MGSGAEVCPGNGVCCNRPLTDRQLLPCKIDWAFVGKLVERIERLEQNVRLLEIDVIGGGGFRVGGFD